jgi:hypothetical protein
LETLIRAGYAHGPANDSRREQSQSVDFTDANERARGARPMPRRGIEIFSRVAKAGGLAASVAHVSGYETGSIAQ